MGQQREGLLPPVRSPFEDGRSGKVNFLVSCPALFVDGAASFLLSADFVSAFRALSLGPGSGSPSPLMVMDDLHPSFLNKPSGASLAHGTPGTGFGVPGLRRSMPSRS